MIKKLRNFIVNPDGQLEKEGRKITADHLIPLSCKTPANQPKLEAFEVNT